MVEPSLNYTDPVFGPYAMHVGKQLRGVRVDLARPDWKGILNVKDTDKPVVIHGVQHVFHPPATLEGVVPV